MGNQGQGGFVDGINLPHRPTFTLEKKGAPSNQVGVSSEWGYELRSSYSHGAKDLVAILKRLEGCSLLAETLVESRLEPRNAQIDWYRSQERGFVHRKMRVMADSQRSNFTRGRRVSYLGDHFLRGRRFRGNFDHA